jgi:hypothetical protein
MSFSQRQSIADAGRHCSIQLVATCHQLRTVRSQLVTSCYQLKMPAADGKQRLIANATDEPCEMITLFTAPTGRKMKAQGQAQRRPGLAVVNSLQALKGRQKSCTEQSVCRNFLGGAPASQPALGVRVAERFVMVSTFTQTSATQSRFGNRRSLKGVQNPGFNSSEFATIKSQAGLHRCRPNDQTNRGVEK